MSARLSAGALILMLAACQQPASEGAPPVPEVGVAVIQPRTVQLKDEFNGRLEAVDAVELRPRVSGYLERVAFKEGDFVKPGDVLFVIDPRPYRIALDRAIAQQQQARAAAQLARVQLNRVQTLMKARATSQEELDNVQASQLQAQASLRAADAAVDDARLNLGYTEVRAPISGRIGRALLTPGNLARADQSLLTTVVSQDPVYVYFDCDEQSFLRYTAQRAQGKGRAIAQAPVGVALANDQGFPHTGTVDFLDNRLDPATGTIRARARLANPDQAFVPGLYARVQLNSAAAQSALLVDDKAVLTDQSQKYVYVIGPENKALRRDVTVGRAVDGQRIVETGLSPGDRVVVEGFQKIFYPGAPVKPVALAAAGAAGNKP